MMNYGVRSQCVDLGGVLKSNVKERLRCSKLSLEKLLAWLRMFCEVLYSVFGSNL